MDLERTFGFLCGLALRKGEGCEFESQLVASLGIDSRNGSDVSLASSEGLDQVSVYPAIPLRSLTPSP